MGLHDAMIVPIPALSAGDTATRALAATREAGVGTLPVVDAAGRPMGMFSTRGLLRARMPVAVPLEGALAGREEVLAAGPGLIKRLAAMAGVIVADVMEAGFATVPRDAALPAVAQAILSQPGPVWVVDEGGRLLGAVTARSFLAEVERLGGAEDPGT
ncbi:MAG TPA: hypothetical protein DDX54_06170 [Rhodospirillaceae bacterium]|jgi:CBS domain-containing protein|nr:CBS domain-containing protein [Alphaproteobacteria bacterium]HBH26970.1 hypothetical protein [Rhodospirillaceae bacterium]